MSTTVCLVANTLYYPQGGGHRWVYLNWALSLRSVGADVIWLEGVEPATSTDQLRAYVASLKGQLTRYGLADRVALCSWTDEPLLSHVANDCLDVGAAAEADLLLNLRYNLSPEIVRRFRRSALLDIDPGLLQLWMHKRQIQVAPHDLYFTTSEAVVRPNGHIPDVGIEWHFTPPCVALDWWPPSSVDPNAPFTTVSHWGTYNEWVEDGAEVYSNDKQCGFEPFLDLPRRTAERLELALCLAADQEPERLALQKRGWGVCRAQTIAATPDEYRRYIQRSRGEFSCAKPSCTRLENGWISDRTLCYLASAKPAVVQHTGPNRLLPDATGLFRFRTQEEAVVALDAVAQDYEDQCRQARALAEEHFNGRKVAQAVLERAL